MVCEICGKGPKDGVTLYRANPKGVKGVWRCSDHPNVESFQHEHDEELMQIDRALSQGEPSWKN